MIFQLDLFRIWSNEKGGSTDLRKTSLWDFHNDPKPSQVFLQLDRAKDKIVSVVIFFLYAVKLAFEEQNMKQPEVLLFNTIQLQ